MFLNTIPAERKTRHGLVFVFVAVR